MALVGRMGRLLIQLSESENLSELIRIMGKQLLLADRGMML